MKWIKVTDKKPEPYVTVIVVCYGNDFINPLPGESVGECIARQNRECIRVTLGDIDEDGYWNGPDGYPMMIAPRYWQPLPETPKE